MNTFFHFEYNSEVQMEFDEANEDIDGIFSGKKTESVVNKLSTDAGASTLLNQLFGSLLRELEEFIDFAERLDS